jgi:N-acetylglutamate synthase-like GNAT family acetyltransferase
MKIEQAKISDAKQLTELTIASKAYWNYSAAQIAEWNDVLTVSEEYIEQSHVYKLSIENRLIGYYAYLNLTAKNLILDNIFIHPDFIGKGYGSVLMNHFLRLAKNKGFERIELDSDPNATAFYHKFGFKTIGQLETSIIDRFIQIMELKI